MERQIEALSPSSGPLAGAVDDATTPAVPLAETTSDSADESMVPYLMEMLHVEEQRADFLLRVVIPLGVALARETDFNHLLERILISAMSLSRADGGAMYLCDERESPKLVLFLRDSLGVRIGGAATGSDAQPAVAGAITLADLNAGEQPALSASRAASLGTLIAESTTSGERISAGMLLSHVVDEGMGYHVESALAVPLRDEAGHVIGVIELCNARRPGSEQPVPFEAAVQRVIEALSLLAAVALESYLRQQRLKEQVQQLRVEVDNAKKHRQVEAIVDSDYFRALQTRARELRAGVKRSIQENV